MDSQSIWRGKRVRLRAVEPEDWKVHFVWDQDSEMARRSYEVPFPNSTTAAKEWAEQQSKNKGTDETFRFQVENHDGDLVGSINTFRCDPRTGVFSYGLGIGSEHRRKGYASEAILLVMRYYFFERRYQKASILVYSFNDASINLHESVGFELEGRLRRMGFTRGQYYDYLFFGMTIEEFTEKHPEYVLT